MTDRGPQFFRPAVDELTPYQPGKPVEDVQRELGLERIVKLASNEGPFPPFPAALEAMGRAARELNRYPDGGSYRLHELCWVYSPLKGSELNSVIGDSGLLGANPISISPGEGLCYSPEVP